MARKYKKEEITDLLLLLPQDKRDENSENVIGSSLKNFFKDQFYSSKDKFGKKLTTGIILLLAGSVTMMVNSYINFKTSHSFFLSFVKILLEPAGWFLLWLGFDFLFYDLREIKKEKKFFEEFSDINIHFMSS